MKTVKLLLVLFCSLSIINISEAQNIETGGSSISLTTSNGGVLNGIIRVPLSPAKLPIAILISGSGPTDKDGNQPMMVNNSLKYLADSLYKKGIATLRFDKRGVNLSKDAGKPENQIILDDYVNDTNDWVNLIKEDTRFRDITLIGHSEGASIAMLTTQKNQDVDKLVLIAGAGRKLSAILKEQIGNNSAGIDKDSVYHYIDQLQSGELIKDIPNKYYILFRPSVQPFLISSFKYDPAKTIAEIHKPILIIQGTTDIQVSVKDAELLSEANPNAKIKLIKNMNHVLKDCETKDQQAQIKTYTNPNLPISSILVNTISDFMQE